MNTNKVFLITSGAFANTEIVSDFGFLPSAFLPIGHNRLIELQIRKIKKFDTDKFITLPKTYKLLERDYNILIKNKIKIHRTDPGLTLNNSILSFLDSYEIKNSIDQLFILHGDTSFKSLKEETDLLYYGYTDMFYKWGFISDIFDFKSDKDNFKEAVIAGYFSFSNPNFLKNVLLEKIHLKKL